MPLNIVKRDENVIWGAVEDSFPRVDRRNNYIHQHELGMPVFERNILRQAETGMQSGGTGVRFAREGELPVKRCARAACQKALRPQRKMTARNGKPPSGTARNAI